MTLGANLQRGQILSISGEVGHEELVRAVALEAYRRGARFVDVSYFDPHVKRARIAHADEETLSFVPPWYGERVLALGEHRAAIVAITGPTAPGLLDGLDPARTGRDRLPFLKETGKLVNDRTVNWTVVPYPTPAWARLVHGDEGEALERLWEEIAHVCRLDGDDPVGAWRERLDATATAASRLNEQRFDAIHFEGPART